MRTMEEGSNKGGILGKSLPTDRAIDNGLIPLVELSLTTCSRRYGSRQDYPGSCFDGRQEINRPDMQNYSDRSASVPS